MPPVTERHGGHSLQRIHMANRRERTLCRFARTAGFYANRARQTVPLHCPPVTSPPSLEYYIHIYSGYILALKYWLTGGVFLRRILLKLDYRLFLSSLGIVFLSEMGDKTQVTTMLLAGQKPLYVLWVALGSLAALICTSFLEVIIGSNVLARFIKPEVVKFLSSGAFIILGILLLAGAIGQI